MSYSPPPCGCFNGCRQSVRGVVTFPVHRWAAVCPFCRGGTNFGGFCPPEGCCPHWHSGCLKLPRLPPVAEGIQRNISRRRETPSQSLVPRGPIHKIDRSSPGPSNRDFPQRPAPIPYGAGRCRFRVPKVEGTRRVPSAVGGGRHTACAFYNIGSEVPCHAPTKLVADGTRRVPSTLPAGQRGRLSHPPRCPSLGKPMCFPGRSTPPYKTRSVAS